MFQVGDLIIYSGEGVCRVDERYMKRAEDMLHGELAVSLGIPKEAVGELIRRSIENDT